MQAGFYSIGGEELRRMISAPPPGLLADNQLCLQPPHEFLFYYSRRIGNRNMDDPPPLSGKHVYLLYF